MYWWVLVVVVFGVVFLVCFGWYWPSGVILPMSWVVFWLFGLFVVVVLCFVDVVVVFYVS